MFIWQFWKKDFRVDISMNVRNDFGKKRVAVIGGGSSGLMAAITASVQGAFVTIYERNERVGKKILVTGNGKCNFTNSDMRKECFYSDNPEMAWGCIQHFGYEDTLSFFEELGVLYKERDGYYYPACEQASVVLDALRFRADELGVETRCDAYVTDVTKTEKGFVVCTALDEAHYDCVILCTGGYAAPKTGSDGKGYKLAKRLGHKVSVTHPALVQLRCEEPFLKQIAGVRAKAKIAFYERHHWLCDEQGEVQLTDYGISGIPVFQCSRVISRLLKDGRTCVARLDFMPEYTKEQWMELFERRFEQMQERNVKEFSNGLLNKKIMQLFEKLCSLKEDAKVKDNKENLRNMFLLCKDFPLTVTAANGYDSAQVTAGGVLLSEVTEHLESVICPGLFFAGEILDVDGICGGYNLQWAWTSGYLAGMQAAKGDGDSDSN